MTMAEFMVESQSRGDTGGPTYAGGMTLGEIQDMEAADAAFRAKRKKQSGATPGQG
jgi:hypothetical protein